MIAYHNDLMQTVFQVIVDKHKICLSLLPSEQFINCLMKAISVCLPTHSFRFIVILMLACWFMDRCNHLIPKGIITWILLNENKITLLGSYLLFMQRLQDFMLQDFVDEVKQVHSSFVYSWPPTVPAMSFKSQSAQSVVLQPSHRWWNPMWNTFCALVTRDASFI